MEQENSARARRYRELLGGSALLERPIRELSNTGGALAAVPYVLAPVLAEFVRWVLIRAMGAGKKRLYFLARDGYFMYEAAKIFCSAFSLPLECRYLSCSRYALRLPLLHTDHGWALSAICRSGSDVSPERILTRAGLTAEERCAVLGRLGLPYHPHRPLPPDALVEMQATLGRCALFLERMDARSAAALPPLIGYLRQEGLTDGTADAIVDSGWVGSIQDALTQACTRAGRDVPLTGWYFGLYDLPRHAERANYHCYYFAPEGDIRRKSHFSSGLFEAVLTAPHGTTAGYRGTDGRYTPVYTAISERAIGFVRIISARLMPYIARFAAVTEPSDFLREPFEKNCAILSRLIRLFMGTPTRTEAEFFGSIPFSDDISTAECPPLAARLNGQELRAWRPLARGIPAQRPIRESVWYAGSAVLYGKNIRRNLAGYTRYQYARHLRNTYLYRKERNL